MLRSLIKTAILAAALAAPVAAHAQFFDENDNIDAYSAIIHASRTAGQVRHLNNVPSVGVISLSAPIVSPVSRLGEEMSDLRINADDNAAAIAQLRHALAANPVTRRALESNGVDIGRIVGVNVGATGSLRVFTK